MNLKNPVFINKRLFPQTECPSPVALCLFWKWVWCERSCCQGNHCWAHTGCAGVLGGLALNTPPTGGRAARSRWGTDAPHTRDLPSRTEGSCPEEGAEPWAGGRADDHTSPGRTRLQQFTCFHRLTSVRSLCNSGEITDLGAADVSVDALAGVALLLPAAAVRKLQAHVTTRLPESNDWKREWTCWQSRHLFYPPNLVQLLLHFVCYLSEVSLFWSTNAKRYIFNF